MFKVHLTSAHTQTHTEIYSGASLISFIFSKDYLSVRMFSGNVVCDTAGVRIITEVQPGFTHTHVQRETERERD